MYLDFFKTLLRLTHVDLNYLNYQLIILIINSNLFDLVYRRLTGSILEATGRSKHDWQTGWVREARMLLLLASLFCF